VVDFLLRGALQDEGECVGKGVAGSSVHGGALEAIQLKSYCQDGAGAVVGGGGAEDAEAAGVWEQADVEVDSLFGIGVEPKEGRKAREASEDAHRERLALLHLACNQHGCDRN